MIFLRYSRNLRGIDRWGGWVLGFPNYDVHPDLKKVYREAMRVSMELPKDELMSKTYSKFQEGLVNYRKRHARPFFFVS